MEELFYRYNPWWSNDYDFNKINLFSRNVQKELESHIENKSIIFLTGLRRVGKTTLLKLLIKKLILEFNINSKYIFYISCDDYNLKDKTILELIEDFRIINKIKFEEKIYLFIDEITYKKDFEIQLKNIYDNYNAKVFCSSSSASILKSKKQYLTGRSFVVEILPLDFYEYLNFKNIIIKKQDNVLKKNYFQDFLKTGGIPEYILSENVEYIKELVDDIIKKDIASFYNIKDVNVLKDMFLLLMERSGKQLSINKIANILGISPDTASRYYYMFEDSYLIYTLNRKGKTNQRILSPKKIYSADLGIRNFFTGFRDIGSLFENYIFLKLKKYNLEYVYEEGNEIDFLINKNILLEVKYDREIEDKQKKLFDSLNIKYKFVVRNIFELDDFLKKIEEIKTKL